MKNFSKNVQDASDDELLHWVNHLDFRVVHLASDELTRRSIKSLNKAIDIGSIQTEKSSRIAERLTVAMFLIAVVQLLVAVFQLILSFAYSVDTKQIILGIFMIIATMLILTYFAHKIFPSKLKNQ